LKQNFLGTNFYNLILCFALQALFLLACSHIALSQNSDKTETKGVNFVNIDAINSNHDEFGAAYIFNKNILYYSATDNTLAGKHCIYKATYKNKTATAISRLNSVDVSELPKNKNMPQSQISNGSVALTFDGNDMYFAGCDYGFGECDLYHLSFNNHENPTLKQVPQNLGLRINTAYWDSHPCISPMGDMLAFSSDREGGFGGRDIWVCLRRADGSWDFPINAGKEVNTKYDEVTPSFSPDDKILYFSSNGYKGLGGFDVCYSTISEIGFFNARTLESVNSNDDDLFFIHTIDNKFFLSSNRTGGKGGLDIYEIENLHIEQSPVFLIDGLVTNSSDKPTTAIIEINEANTGRFIGRFSNSITNGEFTIPLLRGKTYLVTAISNNNYSVAREYNIQQTLDKQIIKKSVFKIEDQGDFSKILLSFKENDHTLKLDVISDLRRWTTYMLNNDKAQIELYAFGNDAAEPNTPSNLSVMRAKIVKNYFVGNGVKADRIKVNEGTNINNDPELKSNQYVKIKFK